MESELFQIDRPGSQSPQTGSYLGETAQEGALAGPGVAVERHHRHRRPPLLQTAHHFSPVGPIPPGHPDGMHPDQREEQDHVPAPFSAPPAHDRQAPAARLRARQIGQVGQIGGKTGTHLLHGHQASAGGPFVLVGGADRGPLGIVKSGRLTAPGM